MLRIILASGLLALIPAISDAQDQGSAQTQDTAQQQTDDAQTDETLNQKASYIIGHNIGQNIVAQDADLNLEQLIKGITEAYQGKEIQLSEEEINSVMTQFQEKMMARQQQLMEQQMAEMQEQAKANLTKAQEFLRDNAQKEGVTQLESGLQYKELESGDGPSPAADSTVRVHYKGTLLNGETFDSSYERGEPITFNVSEVIRGWTEALQLMQVGDKWQLFIPPNLAYGAEGRPPVIPPNSLLVFEVELLGIEE